MVLHSFIHTESGCTEPFGERKREKKRNLHMANHIVKRGVLVSDKGSLISFSTIRQASVTFTYTNHH